MKTFKQFVNQNTDVKHVNFIGDDNENLDNNDKAAFEHAKELHKQGRSPDEIWQQTGEKFNRPIYRQSYDHAPVGTDQSSIWWMKIPTDEMKLIRPINKEPRRLEDILHYPTLYRYHPSTKDVMVGSSNFIGSAKGVYNRPGYGRPNPEIWLDNGFKDSLPHISHELQHHIQYDKTKPKGKEPQGDEDTSYRTQVLTKPWSEVKKTPPSEQNKKMPELDRSYGFKGIKVPSYDEYMRDYNERKNRR